MSNNVVYVEIGLADGCRWANASLAIPPPALSAKSINVLQSSARSPIELEWEEHRASGRPAGSAPFKLANERRRPSRTAVAAGAEV